MIDVCVRPDHITVSGHANYALAGQDIICSGVSVLVQTLIKSIEDLTKDKIQYRISPGWVDIQYRNLSRAGCVLVDSFFIGICAIASEYLEYVRIV